MQTERDLKKNEAVERTRRIGKVLTKRCQKLLSVFDVKLHRHLRRPQRRTHADSVLFSLSSFQTICIHLNLFLNILQRLNYINHIKHLMEFSIFHVYLHNFWLLINYFSSVIKYFARNDNYVQFKLKSNKSAVLWWCKQQILWVIAL